ncbi:nicotinamide riboside transporter PnuC [Chryseosolibacter indicus]|uniref:Nicotinamide riboside transporter PnuC n=1 Tax=Chryseosolibacter indicus TaxID=2782351 RepID=A0ABS5VYA0_9BACT|nr:nicotinamide riboside transporter PnuC [Chryseosolibacter indicus]MBT1705845.1 nicotinamide riboside transporter PnuC [Chryseosolibacter indicus]
MDHVQQWLQALNIDAIQCIVLILGVSEVLLARANNVWLYPTGIAATTLSIYSLFHAKLYAECLLHLYYIVMSIYGWWFWTTRRNNKPVEITFSTQRDWLITIGIVLGGWVVLYFFLILFTPSELPLWDSWVSCTAWAGMWLLARRKVENWLLLNISNAFAIPLLFHKELPLFAFLTLFLFIVACKGYYDWMKTAKKNMAIA